MQSPSEMVWGLVMTSAAPAVQHAGCRDTFQTPKFLVGGIFSGGNLMHANHDDYEVCRGHGSLAWPHSLENQVS